MKMFIGWVKEGEEHEKAFESSSAMQMGKKNLQGKWKTIRKIRLVRLIRRVIEEGIMVKGVKEMYEEGCRILEAIAGRRAGREEGEEGKEEERYMYELWLLKVRGEHKNEVSLLRRELEAQRSQREEYKRGREEEKKRADEERRMKEEEKRKREDAERGREEERRKREEAEAQIKRVMKELEEEKRTRKEMLEGQMGRDDRLHAEMRKREEAERNAEEEKRKREQSEKRAEEAIKYLPVTSLDATYLLFTPNDNGIEKEGNTLIHRQSYYSHNCFIGGELSSV